MPTLPELSRTFLDSLAREQHLTRATVGSYRRSLARFVTWLRQVTEEAEPTLRELTTERVVKFSRWLKRWKQPNGGVLSAAAQNYHLSALRSFLGYLKTHGETAPSPQAVPLLTVNREQVAVLSAAEVERLLAAPQQTNEPALVQLRDQALLELLLSTGLKTAELANLQRNQLVNSQEVH